MTFNDHRRKSIGGVFLILGSGLVLGAMVLAFAEGLELLLAALANEAGQAG